MNSDCDGHRNVVTRSENCYIEILNWNKSDLNEILTLSKKKSYLLTCVYSAVKLKTGSPERSTKRNKYYVKNPQKQLIEPRERKTPWTNNFKPDVRESEVEHQQPHAVNERRLQVEAQTLRRSQNLEQEAFGIAHQREVEVQQLQDQSAARPQLLKEQWKSQVSQQATRKAKIHALHTEISNVA